MRKFADVPVGWLFDFPVTHFYDCVKTSTRKYLFEGADGVYYPNEVGSTHVEVSNIREKPSGFDKEHNLGALK